MVLESLKGIVSLNAAMAVKIRLGQLIRYAVATVGYVPFPAAYSAVIFNCFTSLPYLAISWRT